MNRHNVDARALFGLAIRSVCLFVCLFQVPFYALSQTPPLKQNKADHPTKPALSPEITTLIDMTAGVPSEFGADVLLRLVESDQIADPKNNISILRKAFDLAAGSEEPIKKRVIIGSISDTRSGMLGLAYQLNLDRISLQSRAVHQMVRFNPKLAKDLFDQIQVPNLTSLHCNENLVYFPDVYYSALADVFRQTFSLKEGKDGTQLSWLVAHLNLIQSHGQISPMVNTLVSLDLAPNDLVQATNSLAVALQQMNGDERSFATALAEPRDFGLVGSVKRLFETMKVKRVPRQNLVIALKEYVVSNLGPVRCAELVPDKKNPSIPAAVANFNEVFRTDLADAQIGEIRKEDLTDAKTGEQAQYHFLWESQESKQLLQDIRNLKFGAQTNAPLSASQRSTFNWSAQAQDFMTQLSAWSGTDEDATDYFYEKAMTYETLIDLLPPSPERDQAVTAFVEFLENNTLRVNQIAWYWHAHALLSGRRAHDYRRQVLGTFLNSSNSTLSMYARLELLLLAKNGPEQASAMK